MPEWVTMLVILIALAASWLFGALYGHDRGHKAGYASGEKWGLARGSLDGRIEMMDATRIANDRLLEKGEITPQDHFAVARITLEATRIIHEARSEEKKS